MKNKVVITYGTYDLFHVGHLNLFKKAKKFGDKLIVGVSTDEFNKDKGKNVIIPFNQRVEIVKSIKYVDKVIPEETWEQKMVDIRKYNVDVFVMGHDWEGKFDELKNICKVVYVPRTKSVSTTSLKSLLKNLVTIENSKLKEAFDVLEQLRKDLN